MEALYGHLSSPYSAPSLFPSSEFHERVRTLLQSHPVEAPQETFDFNDDHGAIEALHRPKQDQEFSLTQQDPVCVLGMTKFHSVSFYV